MKMLLTLVVLAVLVLVVMSMVRSWQHRSSYRRAVMLAPFPRPPEELAGPDGAALLPAATGVYAGTSMAGDWQDQVEIGDIGVHASATLHLSGAGLLIDRAGARPLWIPTGSLRGVRTGRALAGRVLSGDGHLVFTWQLGGHLLDTAFRGEEESYPEWLEALRRLGESRARAEDVVDGDLLDGGVPDRGVPDRGGSDRGGSDRGGSDRGGSDRGGPDRGAPGRGMPDRGVPDRGMPNGGVPNGGVPNGGVPNGGAQV